MNDHLVIGDSHTYKGDNLRRFHACGNLIVARQPEVIVLMGDQADMPSLCHYDKGRRDMVFKNVRDDIESVHVAEKALFSPLFALKRAQAKRKIKQYNPKIIKVIGNHEDRVQRLLDYDPQWEGSVSMDMFHTRLPLDETVVPYKDYLNVDGVFYSHLWASGVMGRPFASAKAMVQKRGASCTMGHTHTLDYATLNTPDGRRIRGTIAGSFHDIDHKSFGGPQVDNIWWNGVLYKTSVDNGDYDLEEISIKRLLEEYL